MAMSPIWSKDRVSWIRVGGSTSRGAPPPGMTGIEASLGITQGFESSTSTYDQSVGLEFSYVVS